jgi:large subunit ribosomal protein L15
MQQHQLSSGESRKTRKRVGRGNASGHGTFSGRGRKGQNARSGGGVRPGFEGGQTPLHKRLPKLRGFNNRFGTEYQVINVRDLACFKKDEKVSAEVLLKQKLVRKKNMPVKLLASGDMKLAITIMVDRASKSAIDKIEKAGGKVELLSVE